jgi:flavin reductase (DIM6/NTAB) family NADH-FMN oxidoreductase RutF
MEFNPAELTTTERYKLMIGAVVPRPIAFVSTVSPDGIANVAPFSFFAGVSADPYTLLFCPSNKADGTEKDTLRNASHEVEFDGHSAGQFVVNIVDEAIARRMAITAEDWPEQESEFDIAGLTCSPSTVVKAPRVAESPVAFECLTRQIIRFASGQPSGGNIVIGEVVHVHVRDDIVEDHRIDPEKLGAVGRMAGLTYCTTRQRFDIPWGKNAIDAPEIDFNAVFGGSGH